MASKSENLKKFRHDIALLKRKGLVSNVDARSATPTRRLKAALDKYDAVLSGKATAVKLSKTGIKEYKSLGKPYEIAHPKGLPQRVIIPHEAGEHVTVTHGKVRLKNPAGMTRTLIPVKYHNLPQYFASLRKQKYELKPGEYFAFRFFGNRSHRIYRSMNALVDSLEHYESVFDAVEENDSEAMSELYQNLEIIKLDPPNGKAWATPQKSQHRKWHGLSPYQKRKQKLERSSEWKQEQHKKANAERQAQWRKRLKGAKKDAYLSKARKRKKSGKKSKRKK